PALALFHPPRRELARLALRDEERILRLLAHGDVAQDDCEVAPAALEHLRDGSLDRELLLAPRTQRPQRGHVAHAPAGDPGAAELADVAAVRAAEARRDQPVEARTEHRVALH